MSNETGLKQATLSFNKCKIVLVNCPDGSIRMIENFVEGAAQLLGKLSELTEEQCAGIVDSYGVERFRNYRSESQYTELLHTTARESFLSKLKADGYYTINPHAKTKMSLSGCSAADKELFKHLLKKRKETGEARTFPPDQTYVFIIHKQQS